MKFPAVTKMGEAVIDGRTFVVLLVDRDWEPDVDEHDSDHARGQCTCPCEAPLDALLAAAGASR